jgi:hypothetical protein
MIFFNDQRFHRKNWFDLWDLEKICYLVTQFLSGVQPFLYNFLILLTSFWAGRNRLLVFSQESGFSRYCVEDWIYLCRKEAGALFANQGLGWLMRLGGYIPTGLSPNFPAFTAGEGISWEEIPSHKQNPRKNHSSGGERRREDY